VASVVVVPAFLLLRIILEMKSVSKTIVRKTFAGVIPDPNFASGSVTIDPT